MEAAFMARTKGTGKGYTYRTQIRFDEETNAYYRAKANQHGVSLSEYLRQVLVSGVIAENVDEIDARLNATCDRFAEMFKNLNLSDDRVKLSIYTIEEMLMQIVEARDPSALYAAQDRAKRRLKAEQG
jgi:plasmid stability protein